MSKLDRMATFVKVVEHSSFAGAARSLKISTAAVSKQITLLEDELAVELLHRTTRRLALSGVGQIYFEHCKRIMGEVAEAEGLISQVHAEPFGALRVTSGRHFAERFIIPHLAEFMRRYPKVKLEMELAERIPELQKEGIDVLIGMSMSGPSDVIQRTIAKTRYVICASPRYLQKHGTPKKREDLAKHHYIAHSMRTSDEHVNPILRLNDTNAMLQCALDGVGIVKLHEYVVADALKTKKLRELLAHEAQPELPIYLCYQANRYLQPKIRHFIDFVLGNLKGK